MIDAKGAWALFAAWALAVPVAAADPLPPAGGSWPQWRGPDRTNVSTETGLLPEWPDGGPPLLWRADGLGTGFSPVSVQGGRLYTVAYRGEAEFVVALDQGTGKEVWAMRIGPAFRETPSMRQLNQRPPTVDGDRVYATRAAGELVCLEADRGRELWRKDYAADFGGRASAFGYCDYPLVDGDRLVVTPGGGTATLAALDKRSGAVVWRAAVDEDERADYPPAVVAEIGGVRQYVQSLRGGVVGVGAADGRVLWRSTRTANQILHTAAPVVRGDEVFVAGSYAAPSVLLRVVRDGDAFRADPVYAGKGPAIDNWHAGPVPVGDHLYAGAANRKEFLCVERATGQEVWRQPVPVRCPSPLFADGRMILRYTDGPVTLAEATPRGYAAKGSFRLPAGPGGMSGGHAGWSAPVVAGGRLYLREQDVLYCYDLRIRPPRPVPAVGGPKPAVRQPRPDVPFVPTPQDVVEKMLELAGVTKADVVADLGCGDGRIVVTAAKKYGCRAVGYDLDKECVRAARENVARAGLGALVRIEHADLFTADLGDVTVATLYLGPTMNARLVPQLEKMRPGSRVVSHAFPTPGLVPDKVVRVTSAEDDVTRTLYLWTTPLKKQPATERPAGP